MQDISDCSQHIHVVGLAMLLPNARQGSNRLCFTLLRASEGNEHFSPIASFVSLVTCQATVGQKLRRDEQSKLSLGEEHGNQSASRGVTLSRPDGN